MHYGVDYDNAFWDGSQMVFGDGDGGSSSRFTAVDVIGHELTHGVTSTPPAWTTRASPGALNESVSDVFGSLVKQPARADRGPGRLADRRRAVHPRSTAWRCARCAPGTAYDDPVLGKDPQPAHMRDYVETTDDNGGVHINSGIPNHAFYLAATALGGHAWEVAGRIWYDALHPSLPPSADFATFATATVRAARARFGADEAGAVGDGWAAVGVTTGAAAPSAPGTADARRSPTRGRGPVRAPARRRARPPRSASGAPAGSPGAPSSAPSRWASCPNGDARAWHSLLADDGLPALADEVAGRPRMPDTYCYGVRCETPPLDLELPELELTDDVRSLLERTLGTVRRLNAPVLGSGP